MEHTGTCHACGQPPAAGSELLFCGKCDTVALCDACQENDDEEFSIANCQVCEELVCDDCNDRCFACGIAVCEEDMDLLLACETAECGVLLCLMCIASKAPCTNCGAPPNKARRKAAKTGLEVRCNSGLDRVSCLHGR